MNTKTIIWIVILSVVAYVIGASLTYGTLTARLTAANQMERLFSGGKRRRKNGYKKCKR